MQLKNVITLFVCIYFFCGWTQEHDTLKVIEVHAKKDSILKLTVVNSNVPHYIINQDKLNELGALDIGDALKFIPGVYIKNYGGIGGLKTISYRSLGSAHTSIALDGSILPNTQSGSVNLSDFDVFNTESIEMTGGQVQNHFSSASAYLKANILSITSTLLQPSKHQTELKLLSNLSSINTFQNGFLFKHNINPNLSYGVQSIYTFGSGTYNFKIQNVDSTFTAKRINSELSNFKVKGAISYHKKDFTANLSSFYKNSIQNLPGAVVLYNPFSDQNLLEKNLNSVLSIRLKKAKYAIGINSFVQNSQTTYTDHFFLNEAGILINNYQNQSYGSGIIINRFLSSQTQKVFLGTDYIHAKLNGDQFSNSPIRQSINSVIGLSKWFWKIKFQANLTHQLIMDNTPSNSKSHSHFSPFVSAAVLPFKSLNFRIRAHYKNTYRLPSFNDLYYNFIGNNNLKPEQANLSNIGLSFGKKYDSNLTLETTLDFYNSLVDNKIIAIPTKNLFNWSMQNIGKTKSNGAELNVLIYKKISKLGITISTSQSYNSSVDITQIGSSTYAHQIPYTPKYTASYSSSLNYRKTKITINALHTGKRYTLNENIYSNQLSGFFDIGIGLSQTFNLKQKHLFKINLNLANLLNNNYEVIKSFPMPGRFLLLKIEYKFKS